MEGNTRCHTVILKIPFSSSKHAAIVKHVIAVDRELQAHVVKRSLEVEGNILVATFATLTVRLARLTVNAFLENLDLVVRTLAEFDKGATQYEISRGTGNE